MVTINLNTMVAALDLVRSLADRNLPFHVRTKMNNADSNTPQGTARLASFSLESPVRHGGSSSSTFQLRITYISALVLYLIGSVIVAAANCANFQVLFYLPIYFQSVKCDSAIMSDVYTLPFMCFYTLGSIISGI
jgi:hypothetical protein